MALLPSNRPFLVLLLAPEFYRPLRELGTQRHAGLEGKAAAQPIIEILETELPVNEAKNSKFPAIEKSSLNIVLSGLSYTYPGCPQPALKEVNLNLPPGSCTALVGRSGAGKSTLVNLLLRFMDPQAGSIT